jgi:hypothetical protein
MNYQGVVWQEIFLERHPHRAEALAAESAEATVARTEELHPRQRTRGFCSLTAPCTPTEESAIAYLEAAAGCGFGAPKDANPPKKTKAEREAIKAGIPSLFRSRIPRTS